MAPRGTSRFQEAKRSSSSQPVVYRGPRDCRKNIGTVAYSVCKTLATYARIEHRLHRVKLEALGCTAVIEQVLATVTDKTLQFCARRRRRRQLHREPQKAAMRHLLFLAALTTCAEALEEMPHGRPLPPIRERHDLGGMLRAVDGSAGVELGVCGGRFTATPL